MTITLPEDLLLDDRILVIILSALLLISVATTDGRPVRINILFLQADQLRGRETNMEQLSNNGQ